MTDNNQSVFNFEYQFREGEVRVILEGVEVMRVMFYPDNYSKAIFEKLKQIGSYLPVSEEDFRGICKRVRERLAEKGIKVTDENLKKLEEAAVRSVELDLLKRSVDSSVKLASENLSNIVQMVCEKLLQATFFSGANEMRDILEVPEQKYSAKEIKDGIFQSDWERLKPLIGITTGGARNVKHVWTDEQRACLMNNYKRLKLIWKEAKRIAVSAQKSRESTRSQRWQEEVKGTYPDLPTELIERLSFPRSDEAKPADIALTHAASLCIPVSYSLRSLRDELKEFKARQFKSPS